MAGRIPVSEPCLLHASRCAAVQAKCCPAQPFDWQTLPSLLRRRCSHVAPIPLQELYVHLWLHVLDPRDEATSCVRRKLQKSSPVPGITLIGSYWAGSCHGFGLLSSAFWPRLLRMWSRRECRQPNTTSFWRRSGRRPRALQRCRRRLPSCLLFSRTLDLAPAQQ